MRQADLAQLQEEGLQLHLCGPEGAAGNGECTREVAGALADLFGDLLQIEQCAPAGGAADVLRLDVPHSRALQAPPSL